MPNLVSEGLARLLEEPFKIMLCGLSLTSGEVVVDEQPFELYLGVD